MHSSIEAYLAARKALRDARRELKRCEAQAESAPLPDKLRPAEAADIVEGAIIWYPRHKHSDGARGWHLVKEVDYPSDPFRAFTSHDGCRYGLNGAFVEEE